MLTFNLHYMKLVKMVMIILTLKLSIKTMVILIIIIKQKGV